MTKVCSKCKVDKPTEEFSKYSKSRTGFASNCKQCYKNYRANLSEEKKELFKNNRREWRNTHGKTIFKAAVKKYRSGPLPKIRKKLRDNLNEKFHSNSAIFSPSIGCSSVDLRKYISARLNNGMTMENYKTLWEFDHIIPVVAFDLYNQIERRYANHFLNLQPILREDNIIKGATWTEEGKTALLNRIKFWEHLSATLQ